MLKMNLTRSSTITTIISEIGPIPITNNINPNKHDIVLVSTSLLAYDIVLNNLHPIIPATYYPIYNLIYSLYC